MTPLRPSPVFLPKPWGGKFLSDLYGAAPGSGEAWLVSNLAGERATPVKGFALSQLVPAPLPLVKVLDSAQSLSVQLHPNDSLAQELHGPGYRGKWETWYFLRAPAEGFIYVGLADGVLPGDLLEMIRAGRNPEDLLRRVPIEVGDSIAIEPGTIHSLTQGAVVVEVQTPADLTYRLYDWGRLGIDGKPRELHLEWCERMLARAVPLPNPQAPEPMKHQLGRYQLATSGPLGFQLLRTREAPITLGSEVTRHALTLVGIEGHSELRSKAGAWEPESIEAGNCLVIPPGSGDLLLGGPGEVLLGYLS